MPGLSQFAIPEKVSHVEIASVNYDQWILTVGVRLYSKAETNVTGMVHVIFDAPEGFRLLDEGQMLNFPWESIQGSKFYVFRVESSGWIEQEEFAGNLSLPDTAKEFLVCTDNECISVIAHTEPKLVES